MSIHIAVGLVPAKRFDHEGLHCVYMSYDIYTDIILHLGGEKERNETEKGGKGAHGGLCVFSNEFHTEGRWSPQSKFMLCGCLRIRMASCVLCGQHPVTTFSTLASSQLMAC